MSEGSGAAGDGRRSVDPPAGVHVANPSIGVFISYASQDTAVANAVVETLERNGVRCWIAPRDVIPGSHYADGIMLAISGAKALVLILSESALASKHVGKEVERASSKGLRIIALRTDDAPLTPAFEYFLSESQWIDVGVGGVAAVAAKLVEAVRLHLDPTATSEPSSHNDMPVTSRTAVELRKKWMVAAGVAIVAGTLVWVLADRLWLSKHVAEEKPVAATAAATIPSALAIPEKSVAVLPFVDMSEKKDQEYFSDGLSEELIDMLTKVPNLQVPARTSSFYFKGKQASVADIAKALSVSHVLEGSVRKSGNKLRITAQLIRVDNGYHLWSETYDRQLDDIFKVQDEIADAVVTALKVSLLGGETPRAAPTRSTEAYTLYLQARSIAAGRIEEVDYGAAMHYLQQAVTLDPNFAAAWAAVANLLVDEFSWYGSRPWQEVQAEGFKAAAQALKLDPKLSDGHLAMAKILLFGRDWTASEVEYARALELDPGNADALRWKSYLALALRKYDEELQLAQSAVSHDPLNSWNFAGLAAALSANGRLAEAEAAYRRALDLNPTGAGLHAMLGDVLLAKGDPAAALAEIEREADNLYRETSVPFALDALGRKSEADTEIMRLENKYPAQVTAFYIAEFWACRKDADRAIQWLDRSSSFGLGLWDVSALGFCLKNLESDPRYKALLRKDAAGAAGQRPPKGAETGTH
jgi:TolB-like protein/tetratricopeptide (TPR) repeat protein